MRDFRTLMNGLKPTLLMILVQIIYALTTIFYKLAIIDGMSPRVLTVYRLIFSVPFTIGLVIIFERNRNNRPTWKVLLMSFFSGFFGASLFHNLFLEAVNLASATFANATFTLVPTFTYIFSIILGLEALSLGTTAGKSKLIGTVVGIGGCMVIMFWKGGEIEFGAFQFNLIHHSQLEANSHGNMLLGVLSSFGSSISFAVWIIIQSMINLQYAHPYSSAAMMSVMGAVQATIFALCTENDWRAWHLASPIRILAALFSGLANSGLGIIIITWCIRMRGPVFTSVFNPLMLIIIAIAGPIILEEHLYFGSVLGGIFIISGVLMVLWGKNQERETNNSQGEVKEIGCLKDKYSRELK